MATDRLSGRRQRAREAPAERDAEHDRPADLVAAPVRQEPRRLGRERPDQRIRHEPREPGGAGDRDRPERPDDPGLGHERKGAEEHTNAPPPRRHRDDRDRQQHVHGPPQHGGHGRDRGAGPPGEPPTLRARTDVIELGEQGLAPLTARGRQQPYRRGNQEAGHAPNSI
ncbi:hypothetical protein [Dactylosporangium darangshiense]|uniref:hypothetical protein n=1 Tax=Dactylosporangium darangshiense TaxID=579108 RepID=UPI0031EA9360